MLVANVEISLGAVCSKISLCSRLNFCFCRGSENIYHNFDIPFNVSFSDALNLI